jgi:hypothetical protein
MDGKEGRLRWDVVAFVLLLLLVLLLLAVLVGAPPE